MNLPALLASPGQRMNAQEAEYMELPGARKDNDCVKVVVMGGVSTQLGCCDRFEWEEGTPKQFRCGTCRYLASYVKAHQRHITTSSGD